VAGYYKLKPASGSKFMFNLHAGNHQVILTSETYNDRAGAMNGIKSCQTNSQKDAMFERKTAKDGSPFFVLKAGNAQTIGKSEMYSSNSSMENGVASVKANGASKTVKEA
jgi:uncharacterized protein YegP (UPF0339 family)